MVKFAPRNHSDGYPFDGTGGILAHTFYPSPPNSEPIAGDMHLDADQNWQVGVGIDLFSVALHEAGQALGLGHSDQPGAVMYPYYRRFTGLTDDDIAGIEALYGSSESPVPSWPPVSPPSPSQPPTGGPVAIHAHGRHPAAVPVHSVAGLEHHLHEHRVHHDKRLGTGRRRRGGRQVDDIDGRGGGQWNE